MKYEAAVRKVYSVPAVYRGLGLISHFATAFAVVVYAYTLVRAFLGNPYFAVILAVSTGVPFVLVSVLRKLINAPRPYELLNFGDIVPKSKSGASFPSRHVFSIFAIGITALTVSVPFGVITVALGVLMAHARVLLGMHFSRDVIAGAIIGIISPIIGIVAFSLTNI